MNLLVCCLLCIAFAMNPERENQKLRKMNKVLMKTLKELAVGDKNPAVETDVGSDRALAYAVASCERYGGKWTDRGCQKPTTTTTKKPEYKRGGSSNQKCENTGYDETRVGDMNTCRWLGETNGAKFFSFKSSTNKCYYSTKCDNPTYGDGWGIYETERVAACGPSTCRPSDWFKTCDAGKICGGGGCYECPEGFHECPRDQGFSKLVCPNDKQCHGFGCVGAATTRVDQQTYLKDKSICCIQGEEASYG